MQDEFVLLRCGAWQARIFPQFGMNLFSLRWQNRPVLREPDSLEALAASPYLHGVPLLLPANRTKGGEFSFGGKTYRLPLNEPERGNHLHGLMFDAPFTVRNQTETSLTAAYENRGERYPFPFSMTISDMLNEDGLVRRLRIENTGPGPMPYTLALHATFAEPARFCAPVGERFVCDENYIPTGETAPLTQAERLYRTGAVPKGRAISGFYRAAGHMAALDDIRFAVSEQFDQWVLFNGGGERGFLCIEPQCGEVNGLNRPGGCRILAPQEATEFTISFKREES